jgi:predicted RNase H-like nuclease (RuvC/YqgF family)
MRKVLISAALAAATLSAVPAAAQWQNHPGQGWHQSQRQAERQLIRDIDRLEAHIVRADRQRALHPRTAVELRREVNNLRDRFHRAARNGLSQREFFQLRERTDRLEQRLRYEIRDDRRDRRDRW